MPALLTAGPRSLTHWLGDTKPRSELNPSVISVVQYQRNLSGVANVVLRTAPVPGNLLVYFGINSSSIPTLQNGYTSIATDSGTYSGVTAWKIAAVGESATQAAISTTGTAQIIVELAAPYGFSMVNPIDKHNFTESTTANPPKITTSSVTPTAGGYMALVFAFQFTLANTAPTAIDRMLTMLAINSTLFNGPTGNGVSGFYPLAAGPFSRTITWGSSSTKQAAAAVIVVAPLTGFAGTATTTQDEQTANGSGSFTAGASGTGGASQDEQTASGAGAVGELGTGAAHQDDQRASGSGTVGQTGTGTARQDEQHAAGSGTLTLSGSGVAKQDDQRASGAGLLTISGIGAVAQDHQRASGSETETFTGSGATAQGGQTASGSGAFTPGTSGTGAAAQDHQHAAGVAAVGNKGTGAVAQDAQSAAGSATESMRGPGAVAQAPQTAAGTEVESFVGVGIVFQAEQIAIGRGQIPFIGHGASAQAAQTAHAQGYSTAPLTGTALIVDAGGFDMTDCDLVLVAAPGGPFNRGTPTELAPLQIAANGLTARYLVTVDDFTVGGEWALQLELTTPSGEFIPSPAGLVFITPHLDGEGSQA